MTALIHHASGAWTRHIGRRIELVPPHDKHYIQPLNRHQTCVRWPGMRPFLLPSRWLVKEETSA